MAVIIELTQLSPTMSEGTFVKWSKKKGDAVEPGDILAEVETDKAVMEMEAYDSGILLVQLVGEGERVPVGAPIGIVGQVSEEISELTEQAKDLLAKKRSAKSPAKSESQTSQASVRLTVETEISNSPPPAAPDTPATIPAVPGEFAQKTSGRIIASPLARKIAQSQRIDLGRIRGTGPGGRIVKEDVEAFASSGAGGGTFQSRPDQRVEISSMRRIIAARLQQAKNSIPHFYLTMEFDAEPMAALRENINQDIDYEKGAGNPLEKLKITYNDLIVKACALSLVKHPVCNSSWRGDHILAHGRVDIGIAVALDGGLITPYLRNADMQPLAVLAANVRELTRRARERKLKPEEFSDGTFTISNLGMFGIKEFSAIINEPESAMLAVGALIEKPVVKNGEIRPGKTMSVTLSCDHRVVDGIEGARFLETFRKYMEHPHTLLLR